MSLSVALEITWLPIVLFIIGVVLMAIEMVVPGFGAFGISGLALLCLSVILAAKTFWQALLLALLALGILGMLFILFILLASTGKFPRLLTLRASISREKGFSSAQSRLRDYVGKTGTALSPLRPSGTVDCEGARLDVVTRGEYIEKGEKVVVLEVEGNRVVVAADNPQADCIS